MYVRNLWNGRELINRKYDNHTIITVYSTYDSLHPALRRNYPRKLTCLTDIQWGHCYQFNQLVSHVISNNPPSQCQTVPLSTPSFHSLQGRRGVASAAGGVASAAGGVASATRRVASMIRVVATATYKPGVNNNSPAIIQRSGCRRKEGYIRHFFLYYLKNIETPDE